MKIKQITTKEQLQEFAKKYKLRDDWHEPDEQDVDATVIGERFNNAGTDSELKLLLLYNGKPMAEVALASLCAWAAGSTQVDSRV